VARSGKSPQSSSEGIEFGLQLTLERYSALIRDYALHLGVTMHVGTFVDVDLRSTDGFIDKLVCENGAEIAADLFIDCTGPAALLHSRLDSPFIGWNQWLLCDRIVLSDGMPETAVVSMDRVKALAFGWQSADILPRTELFLRLCRRR
jgi:tryptophan halogenase